MYELQRMLPPFYDIKKQQSLTMFAAVTSVKAIFINPCTHISACAMEQLSSNCMLNTSLLHSAFYFVFLSNKLLIKRWILYPLKLKNKMVLELEKV